MSMFVLVYNQNSTTVKDCIQPFITYK